MEPDREQAQRRRETAQSIGALSTVGLSFVLAIVLGAWFGYLLDTWLGTKSLAVSAFLRLGVRRRRTERRIAWQTSFIS